MLNVFGITGGISVGKSTVSQFVREAGVPVIDLDHIARWVVEPRTPGLADLVRQFGIEILTPEGTLDRKALGARIFSNDADRALLDACLGPHIEADMRQCLKDFENAGRELAAVDGALLVEKGMVFRPLVVVTVAPEIQLRRLMARNGLSEPEARARIAAQMPQAEKLRYADLDIDTDCSFDDLRVRVGEMLTRVREIVLARSSS